MSGSGEKERRRNLQKTLGAQAADAVVRSGQMVQALNAQQRVLAHKLVELEKQVAPLDFLRTGDRLDLDRVRKRLDGVSDWCQTLEDQLAALRAERLKPPAPALTRSARFWRWLRQRYVE